MEVIIDSRNAYRFHKFLNEQGLSYTHETRYTPDNWYTKFVIQGNRDKIISDYFLEDGNRDVDFAADFFCRHTPTFFFKPYLRLAALRLIPSR